MAIYEDPMFVKALKLLNSPAKDSALQMMHLLEEVIDQKYGVGTKTLNLKLHKLIEEPPSPLVLDVPKSRGSRGASPAVLGLSEKSSRSSTPPSEPVSIRTSPDRDDGELALEIFEDDLCCTVCKGLRVTSENRLLECNDCHSLYHQECHKPPVDNDANDPRMVWCCGDCTKRSQEKTGSKSKSSESSKKHKHDAESSHTESSSKKRDADLEPPPKKHRSDDKERSERSSHKKSDKSERSSSSSKSHGSSKSSSSSSSSSKSEHRSNNSKSSGSNLNFSKQPGSPNSKTPSCTANIIAADKRLQNMKKKAAAKMQEKRSNPK